MMVVRNDDGEYVLRVGESDVTTLSVELFNDGEDAHDTTLTITLPDSDVEYLGTDSHVSSRGTGGGSCSSSCSSSTNTSALTHMLVVLLLVGSSSSSCSCSSSSCSSSSCSSSCSSRSCSNRSRSRSCHICRSQSVIGCKGTLFSHPQFVTQSISPSSDCYNARERHTTTDWAPNLNVPFPPHLILYFNH